MMSLYKTMKCFVVDDNIKMCVVHGPNIPSLTSKTSQLYELYHKLVANASESALLSFFGGRIAMQLALAKSLVSQESFHPILRMESGAPLLPHGTIGSISHKSSVAVSIATTFVASPSCSSRHVGVDIEHTSRATYAGVARRILTGIMHLLPHGVPLY
jgi:4'-phosphopantetheinyl transferase EntD